MEIDIIVADVLDWAREYEGEKFHALLSDPPWHLKGGFMGRYWDRDGPDAIAFQPETWAALAEHLYPGAFLFVFAGSRGWHRLACALEDAGMIIQPSIFVWGAGVVEVPFCLGWLQGQAFPKASRTHKEPVPKRKRLYHWLGWVGKIGNWFLRKRGLPPKCYLDFVWQGHRYGGQVLKDALGPVVVAMKPWTNPRLDCIVRTGAGAMNVDKARVKTDGEVAGTSPSHSVSDGWDHPWRHDEEMAQRIYETKLAGNLKAQTQGRWPPNFALCHIPPHLCPDCEGNGCEACGGEGVIGGCKRVGVKRVRGTANTPRSRDKTSNPYHLTADNFDNNAPAAPDGYADPDGLESVDAWECAEGCVCAKLGEQSGEREVSGSAKTGKAAIATPGFGYGCAAPKKQGALHNDKGTAARFFPQCGWEFECVEACPVAKLDEQAGERKRGWTLGGGKTPIYGSGDGITTNPSKTMDTGKPRGYPDTGSASRFYQQSDWSYEIAERLATSDPVRYCPKAAKRERNEGLDDFYWRKDKESPIGFVRITEEEWEALGVEEERIEAETGKRVSLRAQGNIHPTVKPISLCKWLATLLLPPKEYAPRRILIPFCGTFREGIGAMLAGWDEMVGIELYRDYVDIAEAGAQFWACQLRQNIQLSFLGKGK